MGCFVAANGACFALECVGHFNLLFMFREMIHISILFFFEILSL